MLTPHAGELARLLRRRAATRSRRGGSSTPAGPPRSSAATVLLKGSTTVVAEAGRPGPGQPDRHPWLATAGSGDVLSGLIGALLAGGLTAIDAAAAGAYLHGLAGRLAADPTATARRRSPRPTSSTRSRRPSARVGD